MATPRKLTTSRRTIVAWKSAGVRDTQSPRPTRDNAQNWKPKAPDDEMPERTSASERSEADGWWLRQW